MKTHTITTYNFSELSDEAKQSAYENAANAGWLDWPGSDEAWQSLQAFCDCLGLKADDMDARQYHGYCLTFRNGYGINSLEYRGESGEAPEELSGHRLVAHLEYMLPLFERKVYRKGDTKRTSRITWQDTSCPFTGVCFDEDLLQPIREYCKRPAAHHTLASIVEDALGSFERAITADYEYSQSFERFAETAGANEYQFLKDGTIY